MTPAKRPAAPRGTSDAGKRLWRSVLHEYELEEHEVQLLVQAVGTVDVIEKCKAIVAVDGPLIDSPQGGRTHPLLVELRQQRIALARLLAALRMPAGDESEPTQGRRAPGAGSSGRPQRRAGTRGVYGPRRVS